MKDKTLDLKKGDTPVRASEALVIEPAKSWQRLQQAKEFFVDLEVQAHEHHQLFLNQLMEYERQSYLKYEPYERGPERSDQALSLLEKFSEHLFGILELRVPRSRSGKLETHEKGGQT